MEEVEPFFEGAMVADLAGGEGSEDEAEAALGTESGRLQQIWERIARGLRGSVCAGKGTGDACACRLCDCHLACRVYVVCHVGFLVTHVA